MSRYDISPERGSKPSPPPELWAKRGADSRQSPTDAQRAAVYPCVGFGNQLSDGFGRQGSDSPRSGWSNGHASSRLNLREHQRFKAGEHQRF